MPKKNQTPANPFVPVEEQPYPIPENWCWVRLQSISKLFNGDRGTNYPSKKDYVSFGIPFINAGAIIDYGIGYNQFNYITREKYNSLRAGKIQQGDILYCLRGSLGKTAIVKENIVGAISSSLCIIRVEPSIEKKYMYFLLTSDAIIKQQGQAENGSAQPNLSAASVMAYSVPLPPLPEQHRIVSLIESLFAKLDEAKEKAQAVVDGFELRKSAILHKAFTGELTERWRKEHGVGLGSWKTVPFNDCIQKMQNGLAKRNGNIGKSYVVLRLANLTEDGFDTSDLREILLDEKEQESYSLAENDVIMVRVNGSKDIVGRQLLVPKIENWAFCDHIIRIRYQNNILPDYMIMFSKSERYRAYVKDHMVSSAGQNTISRKGMANMAVPVPEEDEQREIVRLLSIIFSKEQQAKETAKAVLIQIDTMKKAILARAFRGELGTNDPAEEWAGEMVKAVL